MAPSTSLNATLPWRSQKTGSSTPRRRATRPTNGPAASTKRGVAIVRAPPCALTFTALTRPPVVSTASTRPSSSRTPLSRARSSMYMPSCWPLNQPHRRAWTRAIVSSVSQPNSRRMSARSVMTSIPVGCPSKPSAGAGR